MPPLRPEVTAFGGGCHLEFGCRNERFKSALLFAGHPYCPARTYRTVSCRHFPKLERWHFALPQTVLFRPVFRYGKHTLIGRPSCRIEPRLVYARELSDLEGIMPSCQVNHISEPHHACPQSHATQISTKTVWISARVGRHIMARRCPRHRSARPERMGTSSPESCESCSQLR